MTPIGKDITKRNEMRVCQNRHILIFLSQSPLIEEKWFF